MAGQIPSFTSYAVAKGTYAVSCGKHRNLAGKGVAEAFAAIVKKVEQIPQYKKYKFIPSFLVPSVIDFVGLKGLALHYMLRKNFIESKLREFLAAGHKQIVILGGGLDTLGIRVANEQAGLLVVEIDQASTQNIKQSFVAGAKSKVVFNTSNLEEKSLAEILSEVQEFDSDQPSFFICEGVLMYLSSKTVRQIFSYIASFTAPAWFAFTALERLESVIGDKQFAKLGKAVKKKNEKFISELSSAMLETIPSIEVVEKVTYKNLQAPYRKPKYTAKLSENSEYICFIRKK